MKRFITVAIIMAIAAGVALWLRSIKSGSNEGEAVLERRARELLALQQREELPRQTVWASEIEAQAYGDVFERLWNELKDAVAPWEVLKERIPAEILIPRLGRMNVGKHGVTTWTGAEVQTLTGAEWQMWIRDIQEAGWILEQVEFRHNQFTPAGGGSVSSVFYFSAHLRNNSPERRAAISGDLKVTWTDGEPVLGGARVDASGFELKTREGAPLFELVLDEEVRPPRRSYFIDPLIVKDMGGDGVLEVILAAANRTYRLEEDWTFASAPLLQTDPGLLFTAIIADFTGDGVDDFLGARFEGMQLWEGQGDGEFANEPRLVWGAAPRLKYGQALTCGDVNLDGDLDIWLGQYQVPYEGGRMPSPYFDANDGNPSFLLVNDGRGSFHDGTEEAGLGEKRRRHVYSGSLVDLDQDGDLDLVTISDFAGVDLFYNDGLGRFEDRTGRLDETRHGFGMAHALTDFNSDGRLDLLMIGMNSPAADRLEHLGLERVPGDPLAAMRGAMAYGNRLFLGGPDGALRQGGLSDSIARAGWAWGCGAGDLDNDGFPDVYIGNGHDTRQSVEDYEPYFWMHDIYVGDSEGSVVLDAYFQHKFLMTRGKGQSYGGYEKNRLYLNRDGAGFEEVGYLMGVALEADSRNVAAEDLDGDGRLDLLVTTFEAWPRTRQTLKIYRNKMVETGNWIGFRFGEAAQTEGAVLTLKHSNGRMARTVVTGDSYRIQQANVVHFGLGDIEAVESVEVQFVGGRLVEFQAPEAGSYYWIR